jgi:hypothetical protein
MMTTTNQIQHSEFHDGSFVLHKVMLNDRKYSAWYGKDGTAKDAELFLPTGHTRTVSENQVNVWNELNTIGRRYVSK